MEFKEIDGNTLRRMLCGGAVCLSSHINDINELNVFPVPDGDTGTNMYKTVESGITRISGDDDWSLRQVCEEFEKGSLLGARGNSGVILSQFFAGLCEGLKDKDKVRAHDMAKAYIEGVRRAYKAVTKPVEGTILTVFRESSYYADKKINENSSVADFLGFVIEEAERSLKRTKEMLPVLAEADVVDSGGAGYLCIAKGMYEALCGKELQYAQPVSESVPTVDYDLFGADSVLEFGYCTEALVRLLNSKCIPEEVDASLIAGELEKLGCDSVVTLRDGDILKVHAHTFTPSDVLTLCQRYGEFLNVKIENMSLQHSERKSEPKKTESVKKPKKAYGAVTVANGEGIAALFTELGADVVINGGQTGNPSASDFLLAYEKINAENNELCRTAQTKIRIENSSTLPAV